LTVACRGSRAGRLFALAALAVLSGCSASGAQPAGQGFVAGSGTVTVLAEAERAAAPPVAGQTLDGERVALADFAGQVVVVNVWGSWCVPCRTEAPRLAAAADRLAGEGVRFLGVNIRDSVAQARAFVRRYGLAYPSIFDPDGSTLLGFRDTLPPNAIPSTLVVDRSGRVAARVLGEVDETTLVGLARDVVRG
jgi:thiol-disulfide isomerase/thioredoxin